MSWPLSQDFNEAVQNPATSFADPDLKAGKPAVTPRGVPLPRSGNYADVYQFTGPDGRRWAVKCFTRPVAPDLEARYAAIAEHLARANLPFTVGFDFLRQGVRVRGKFYPVVKMPWVDGYPINQFVREHLNRATPLEAMLSLWVRLCRRLRETGMAHGDLQHGNVLLVPAGARANALELKLVDYDGMFVPALAGRPTGEAGHAAYQHPERAAHNVYSADLDRFPHLVVATALRGLLVGGEALWRKYDTGDNLLFTEADFRDPGRSKLMRELWDSGDPFTVGLLAHLVLACVRPLPQTPWLDQLMPEGRPPVLTPSQEREAAARLGVPVAAAVAAAPPPGHYPYPPPGYAPPPAQPAAPGLAFDEGEEEDARPRRKPAEAGGKMVAVGIGGGLLALAALVGVALAVFGGKKPTDTVRNDPPPQQEAPKPSPAEEPKEQPAPPVGKAPVVTPQPGANAPGSPPTGTPPVLPPGGGRVSAVPPVGAPREVWAVPLTDDSANLPHTVKFSADGSRVLANERGTNRVHSFDTATGRRAGTFREFPAARTVAFHPLPGGRVLSAGPDPFLIVWDDATGKPVGKVPAPLGVTSPAGLTATRDGRYALLTAPGRAVVISLPAGEEVLNKDVPEPAAAVLAADGSKAALPEPGGKVQFYGLAAKQPTAGGTVPLPGVAPQALAPAGRNLFAAREVAGGKVGRDIHVIDAGTFKPVRTLAGSYAPAAPKFTADGRFLFAAAGPMVEGWNTDTWQRAASAVVQGAAVMDFDVSPDGRWAVAVAADRKVHLFDLGIATPVAAAPAAGGRTLRAAWAAPFDVDPVRAPRAVRFSPDGTRLVAPAGPTPGQPGAVVHTFDAATGRRLATATEPVGPATAFPLPDGRFLSHPGNGNAVRVLDAVTGKELDVVQLPFAGGAQITGVTPDGRQALVRRGTEWVLTDLKTGKAVPLTSTTGTSLGRLSPDGAGVLVTDGPRAKLYATADGRLLTSFDLPFPAARAVALAPGLKTAAVLPFPGRMPAEATPAVHVIDVAAGRVVKTLPGVFAPVTGGTGLQFSRDGRWLGAVRRPTPTDEFAFEVWDAASWESVARSADPVAAVGGFDFSPDGRRVVVWGADGKLRALDLPADVTPGGSARPEVARAVRRPVPDAEAAAKADALVKETYKADFARKAPADQRRLAEKLIRDAEQETPANRYALLRAAAGVAAEMPDIPLAAKAIDALDQEFEIDGPAEKVALVEKVVAGTTQTGVMRPAAAAALELAEELAEKDRFDDAMKLAGLAAATLAKAGPAAAAKDAEARQQQLKKLRDAFEPVRAAAEALKANPADPAAAVVVGKYRCFVQGRWDDGLPLLAAGSDPALRKLAEQDLRSATDVDLTDVQRGDAWAAAARQQPEADRRAYQARAKFWYARALTSLRGGLELEAAKAKLAFTHGGTEYRPGLVAEFFAGPQLKTKRKGQIDLAVDFSTRDHPTFNNVVRVVWTGVLVPPAAGRYKLIADTTDPVYLKVFAKPDQRTLFDTKGGLRPEAVVALPDRPVPVEIAYAVADTARSANHTFTLRWVRPGAKGPEVVPPEVLFHAREAEKLVTEK